MSGRFLSASSQATLTRSQEHRYAASFGDGMRRWPHSWLHKLQSEVGSGTISRMRTGSVQELGKSTGMGNLDVQTASAMGQALAGNLQAVAMQTGSSFRYHQAVPCALQQMTFSDEQAT